MPTSRPQARRIVSLVTACLLCSLASLAGAQNPAGGNPTLREPAISSPNLERVPRPAPRRLAPDATSGFGSSSEKENRLLVERVDPDTTLDVVQGRPTVLRFRVPPFRDQVGDPEIAELASISESEISVTGKQVGSTTVNLWFKDPQTGRQEVLSYSGSSA